MQSNANTTPADSGEPKTQDDNEEKLYTKAIMRAYARRSALLEPTAIHPPGLILNDDTLQEGPEMQEGELTDGLFMKLLNDPRVWSLTALNLIVAVTCFAILIITAVFLIKIVDVNKTIAKISNREQPCLYQWSEWSLCSETCSSSSRLPSRSRHVLNKTIIQARGRFPACPSNLETMTEYMPCNVYRCPVNLSSFTTWTQCFYKDPNIREAGGCYRMRDLPTTNQLIYMDTDNLVKDESELFDTKIIHGYAQKSALSNEKAILPHQEETEQKTLDDEPEMKEGCLTQELSDVTEIEEDIASSSLSFSYTLYKRIMRDPRVRMLTAVNFMVILLCLCLFITITVFLIKTLIVNNKIAKISENELPCMYQWSEWSACSETCMSTSEMPSRSRHVHKKSIIRSRGKFPPCPENLATMVERMPCNIYRCPINLSSITGWTQCFYKNPSKGAADGCYRIRDIPTVNQLIYIDTTNVTEDCKCPSIVF
uniref:Bm10563 n=1 Tax=Brugia malayi TaxID=6279 RepID=A0A0H5SAV3_BRUMA|nr:Bm10563 [Brugia malayi]